MTNYLTSPKEKVLDWLRTLRLPDQHCRYQFSKDSDDTIFSTCFALFILDLFKETKQFTEDERKQWVSYIQGFQNKEYGYFEPQVYYHTDKERNSYQLTCFCLSALKILDAEPKFPLSFVEQWRTPDDVKRYLYEKDCHLGKPGSGNKAMFLAIFLTYEYERTGEAYFLDKVNAWFELHDESQNVNGLWGKGVKSSFFRGLQNGFHQLLIYFYWHKQTNRIDRTLDIVLKLQDKDGYFAPTPGGEACHDYDATHILVNAYNILDYRRKDIRQSLRRAYHALLQNQNADGGFCQSKKKPDSIIDMMRFVPFCLYGNTPYVWYYRLRRVVGTVVRTDFTIYTGWTQKNREWHQSNLWDTWFRCLALAEIAHTIDDKALDDFRNVQFHKTPGLGHFLK